MMPTVATAKTTWLATALAFAALLGGCQAPEANEGDSATESEIVATNGLTMINGLAVNGLSGNGLRAQALVVNPLSTAVSATTYLMNSAQGRETLSYLVRCALPAGHNITRTDLTGASYTFAGGIGLTPEWETGTCGGDCQRWLSACMLAHVNTAGVHVPIWIVGQNTHLGWGQSPAYPNQEGTFFGNIFTTNEVGHTDAYYCEGPGFDKSVVDGRIGSNQVGAPYRDMFASGYCHINGCLASDITTNNVADGYKVCSMGDGAMTTWNQLITVWRQNVGVNSSGQVVAGTTADGRKVKFDFEGDANGWTSGNTQMTLASSTEVAGQTGGRALKVAYNSGSSTLRLQSATTLSIAAGTKVTFYLRLASDSKLTAITPWVRKNGSSESKQTVSVSTLLKGSWNVVNITVPSGITANQVGVDFATSGAFSAYVDSVTY